MVCAGQTSPAATGSLGNIAPNTLAGDTANGGGTGTTYTTTGPSTTQGIFSAASGAGFQLAGFSHTHFLTVTPRYFAIQYIEKVN